MSKIIGLMYRINFIYYLVSFVRINLPQFIYNCTLKRILKKEKKYNRSYITERVSYLLGMNTPFNVSEEALKLKNIKRPNNCTSHYLDFKQTFNLFSNRDLKVDFYYGDCEHENDYPTITRSRLINQQKNSPLLKLDKIRHFQWVTDKLHFKNKIDKVVWRGTAYNTIRIDFLKMYHNNDKFDIGQTNKQGGFLESRKKYMSKFELLKYKFIFCPEGNDVATGLKWIMSSSSICVMPKPTYETWFMEGRLIPGYHYIQVKDDLSDIENQIEYYLKNSSKCEEIIKNANEYTQQFRDKDFERLLEYKVLEKYFQLSGQINTR